MPWEPEQVAAFKTVEDAVFRAIDVVRAVHEMDEQTRYFLAGMIMGTVLLPNFRAALKSLDGHV
jgi:hypothetical protein